MQKLHAVLMSNMIHAGRPWKKIRGSETWPRGSVNLSDEMVTLVVVVGGGGGFYRTYITAISRK